MVSRSIYDEISEGRGIDGKDYVYLDLTHLPPRSSSRASCRTSPTSCATYLGIDPTRAGPDPADGALRDGRHSDRRRGPRDDRRQTAVLPGLYARGEVGLRFSAWREPARHQLPGRPDRVRPPCRPHAARYVNESRFQTLPPEPDFRRALRSAICWSGRRARTRRISGHVAGRDDGQGPSSATAPGMARCGRRRRTCETAFTHVGVQDKGKIFNTDLTEALELGYMLDCSRGASSGGNRARREPRGTFARGLSERRRRQLAQAHARLP